MLFAITLFKEGKHMKESNFYRLVFTVKRKSIFLLNALQIPPGTYELNLTHDERVIESCINHEVFLST